MYCEDTLLEGLEDHLAMSEALESVANIKDSDDSNDFKVPGIQLWEDVTAQLKKHNQQQKPVGHTKNKRCPPRTPPISKHIQRKLRREKYAKEYI